MKNCSICKKEQGKYKCPTCLIYYCSVNCCKIHRETSCELTIPPKPEPKEIPKQFTTNDTVDADKLILLKNDKDLKGILTNPHLRELLKNLDSCDNPTEMIEKAMHEPLFTEFADACLKVVEPDEHT